MKPLGAASSSPGGPAAAGAASAARYVDDIGLAISFKKVLISQSASTADRSEGLDFGPTWKRASGRSLIRWRAPAAESFSIASCEKVGWI